MSQYALVNRPDEAAAPTATETRRPRLTHLYH